MPGTTRELTNLSDFPRENSPDGTEVLPAVKVDGSPVGIPSSALVQDGGISGAHIANVGNPHSVTADQVGLGQVDNTSDLDKPVSTAAQALIRDDVRLERAIRPSMTPGLAYELVDANNEMVAGITVHGEFLGGFQPETILDRLFQQTSEDGDVLFEVDSAGGLRFGNQHVEISMDGSHVWTDGEGTVIGGRNRRGVDVERAAYRAWVDGSHVWASVFGKVQQVTAGSLYSYVAASVEGGLLHMARSGGAEVLVELSGSIPPTPGVQRVLYLEQYGQSGGAANASQGVIHSIPFNDRFWTFDGSPRVFGDFLGHTQNKPEPQVSVPHALLNLKIGREKDTQGAGETAISGAVHGLLSSAELPQDFAILATCSAVGSANAQMLVKDSVEDPDGGSGPNLAGQLWSNLELKAFRGVPFLRLQRLQPVFGPMMFDQGEGNFADDKATYMSRLTTIHSDWEELGEALNCLVTASDGIGFPGRAPLVLNQLVSGAHYNDPESEVPWAQLQVNLDDPQKFLCAGPNYDNTYAPDGVHPTKDGQEMKGARSAVAVREWLSGNNWMPLHIRKDSGFEPTFVSASTIRLRIYNHFDFPLTIDNPDISGLGADKGFQFFDDSGSTPSVSGVTLVDNTTIDLTLASTPSGSPASFFVGAGLNGTLGGDAGPTEGNRTSVRTNGSTVTTLGQQSAQRTVEHLLCIDKVAVV